MLPRLKGRKLSRLPGLGEGCQGNGHDTLGRVRQRLATHGAPLIRSREGREPRLTAPADRTGAGALNQGLEGRRPRGLGSPKLPSGGARAGTEHLGVVPKGIIL